MFLLELLSQSSKLKYIAYNTEGISGRIVSQKVHLTLQLH